MHTARFLTPFNAAVATVAAAKILVAATTVAVELARSESLGARSPGLLLAHVAAFGLSGLLLLGGGKRDHRARLLGIVFLLVASMFADPLVRVHAAGAPSPSVAERVMALQVDAFTPFFLWSFVRDFPRVVEPGRLDGVLAWVAHASLWIGSVLFGANLLLALGAGSHASLARWLLPLSPWSEVEVYWPVQLLLLAAALPLLVWRTQRAPIDERRRVALLVAGLVVGIGPTVGWILLHSTSTTMASLLPLARVRWLTYPTLLSTPFTTAYAVLMRKALDVRLVIRRALQYALARYSALVLAAIPVGLLALALYRRRNERVMQLVSTPAQVVLVVLAMLGLLAMRRRGEVLRRIDRRFFREQYDARRILGQLVERCRAAADAAGLAGILRAEIDRALHLHAVHLLFLDPQAHAFVSVDASVRRLDADVMLTGLLERCEGALDVDLEQPNAPATRLREDALHWILDAGARLLLPVRDRGRHLIGVLVLGEKRSELPFSREDLDLLAGVLAAAEMAIAYRSLQPRSLGDADASAEARAAECVRCGSVQARGEETCTRCGGETVESVLPQVVAGKFLIDQRIGAGGMGVVYRGMDVHLGRLVAIKTLPLLTPKEAIRLQREARTMASFSHPNLALIFGAEVWQGQPLLVFEYLAGGTLADRLRHGSLGARRAIALGLAMASVLDAIHRAGVLHRDIKPSNIGFTADGVPKLLDFGLARLMTSMESVRRHAPTTAEGGRFARRRSGGAQYGAASVTDGVVRGTPLYMSPEAADGRSPDPSFDLWSLSVVLYEAVFGRHPFAEHAVVPPSVAAREPAGIVSGDQGAALHPAIAEFFLHALSERREERPSSAQDLVERLRRLDPAV